MEFIQIANVTMPVQQLAAIIALFGAWLYVRIQYGKSFADRFGNTAFLFVIVWKFSIILFQFPLVLQAPISILYFNGGTYGFWLGLAVALLYAYIKKMPSFKMAGAWASIIVLYPLASSALLGTWTVWIFIQAAGSILFFFVAKEGLERALTLLLFWQLLFLSAEGRLIGMESLVYIIVTAYFIIWRKKT
ncbi:MULTISPECIES: hypothetical protein [Bacillaceae]|uniref:Uncharacterized protein n=1 Tax=Domibacillus aminovorans TaxID=29332 RepID=A0A177KQ13_9BACI|nr:MULTISPECIES: hypothetical protein [Bacillaceae]OAH54651.1 hypothetical protein AWH48_08680 [Domibacillus aminovorans]